MAKVVTVLGEVPAADLGVVLPHEHLLIDLSAQWEPRADGEIDGAFDALDDQLVKLSRDRPCHYYSVLGLSSPALAIEELQPFIGAGGRTIVELTNWSLGRQPQVLAAISRATGLHVVIGTGEYREMAHSGFVRHASVGQLRDMMIADITEGAAGGVRAGIIGEIGTGSPVTDMERKVLLAACQAQQATGVVLNIHRTPWPDQMAGLEALRLVLDSGIDPARVVMSHCDERPGSQFALEVARQGAYVSCDTFGMQRWASASGGHDMSADSDRLAIVEDLLAAGHIRLLLLSQDVCQKTQLRSYGGFGYAHIDSWLVPELISRGCTDDDVRLLRVENPARMLAIQAPTARPEPQIAAPVTDRG